MNECKAPASHDHDEHGKGAFKRAFSDNKNPHDQHELVNCNTKVVVAAPKNTFKPTQFSF